MYDVSIEDFDLDIDFIIAIKRGDNIELEVGGSINKKVIWRCQFQIEDDKIYIKSSFAEKSKRMFK